MCGICGMVDPAGFNLNRLQAMMAALTHRGPDDAGHYQAGSIGLGNRRLSIIDLAGGKQPISNEDESIWLVFNGEIYNYGALRAQLVGAGHHFRTQSDTEVIVHLYEEYGLACLRQLRGMFALALWDSRRQHLLLARDHLGQKPLFYAQRGDKFLFASEIKALLASGLINPEMDYASFHHYLSLRFVPPPQTMLTGVHKLPPAHYLLLTPDGMRIERFWQLSFRDKVSMSDEQLLAACRDKLIETTRLHMISDVPVGAFLSGGMDSSMVVATMAQELGEAFSTFAVGVREQDFNELPYAAEVARRHKTNHIEACVDAELVSLLPKIIWHLDEPSDPISACQYHAAALAAQHVKVVLGGDGGDELFAGFDRYLGLGWVKYYAWLPEGLRSRLFGPLWARLGESASYKSRTQQLRWLHQLADQSDPADRYAEATGFFRFSHADKQELYSESFWRRFADLRSEAIISEHYRQAPAEAAIERMLYADYQTRLPEHSLMLTDRLTMAHGLELRSPFLDHELVELLASFPLDFKIRGRTLKYGLRQLGQDYLPASILNRAKQGFMFPIAYWFRGALYPLLCDWLPRAFYVREGLIRPESVNRLIEEHRQGRADHHVRLWMLLNAEIWQQIYIQGKSIAELSAALQSSVAANGLQRSG